MNYFQLFDSILMLFPQGQRAIDNLVLHTMPVVSIKFTIDISLYIANYLQ